VTAGAEYGAGSESTQDWPRWRGFQGNAVWRPPQNKALDLSQGVTEIWRQSISPGYSGIAVARHRVYTQDRPGDPEGQERVLCLDADTGELVWEYRYEADYTDLDYDKGPRATPLVDDDRVYTLGAVGHLHCLDARTGEVLWKLDLKRDFGARQPMWGFAASPIRHGENILVHPGAADGCYMAFERRTGKLVWKGGTDDCGYATPIVIRHAEREQLIGWTPEHIVGLAPESGAEFWRIPYSVTYGVSMATPIFHRGIVFVSGYWEGSKAIQLGDQPEQADLVWEENRQLRGVMSEPLYRDGHVYLLDKRFGIICFELETGKILWSDLGHVADVLADERFDFQLEAVVEHLMSFDFLLPGLLLLEPGYLAICLARLRSVSFRRSVTLAESRTARSRCCAARGNLASGMAIRCDS
jgi:outer membrane protein assembly factor BamB